MTYEVLESQGCTKWIAHAPALRISCFISNGAAQPGKLIKVCSRARTEGSRRVAAPGECCFSMSGWQMRFYPFLSCSHLEGERAREAPLKQTQCIKSKQSMPLHHKEPQCTLKALLSGGGVSFVKLVSYRGLNSIPDACCGPEVLSLSRK